MKKLLISLLLGLSFLNSAFALNIREEGEAGRFLDNETLDIFENLQETTQLPGKGLIRDENTGNIAGVTNLASIIVSVIQVIKYALSGLMLLMFTISLSQLVNNSSDEAALDKTKTYLKYLVVAVAIVFMAEPIFINYLSLEGGGFLSSTEAAQAAATGISSELFGAYRIIQSIIGIVAVFMIIFGAFKMSVRSYQEEDLSKAKNQILYGSLGIIVIILAETLVTRVLFDVDSGFDPNNAKQMIVSITNFVSGFTVLASLLGLLYAGYLYVVSAVTEDNSDKIKSAVKGSIIGLILASSAFAIVNTVIKLDTGSNVEVFDENSLNQ